MELFRIVKDVFLDMWFSRSTKMNKEDFSFSIKKGVTDIFYKWFCDIDHRGWIG